MGKKVKRKFNFKKFIIFIIIVFVIVLFSYYLLSQNIRNIIILNNNYYNDEVIIETSGIEDYPLFVSLSKKEVKNKHMKLDLVSDVKVSKKFPFTIEIDVTEKNILYYVRSKNLYKLSDNSELELSGVVGYPTLVNYVPSDIEEDFVSELKKIDQNIIKLISEIEYSKISYDDERFLLYMVDGNEVYITISKMDKLNKYLSIIEKLDNKKGILYLDSGNYLEIKK